MTAAADPLSTFLLAAIADHEAAARAAEPLVTGVGLGIWTCEKFGHLAVDPAHVLATCAAHRRIVELAEDAFAHEGGSAAIWMDDVLRALSAVYADRPGYEAAVGS